MNESQRLCIFCICWQDQERGSQRGQSIRIKMYSARLFSTILVYGRLPCVRILHDTNRIIDSENIPVSLTQRVTNVRPSEHLFMDINGTIPAPRTRHVHTILMHPSPPPEVKPHRSRSHTLHPPAHHSIPPPRYKSTPPRIPS